MSLYALAQHFHFNLCLCVTMGKLLSDAVAVGKKKNNQMFKATYLK